MVETVVFPLSEAMVWISVSSFFDSKSTPSLATSVASLVRRSIVPFLWHTMTDDVVPVENSLLFVQQLHRYGVACECHLFESGRHGMSVATREGDAASRAVHAWVGLCQTWVSARFGRLGGDAE